jgi:hypothetical protein
MANGVSYRLYNRISNRFHGREPLRIREHMLSHLAALGAVAVEQHLSSEPIRYGSELPSQIEGVLHAGVHALTSRRTVRQSDRTRADDENALGHLSVSSESS